MMKILKHIITIFSLSFVLLLSGCGLSGCGVNYYYYEYDSMIARTNKIEIIDIVEVYDHHKPVETMTFNLLGIIEDELIDDFLLDLSKIRFSTPLAISNPCEPYGIAFLVYYNDGTRDVIDGEGGTYGNIRELGCYYDEFTYLVEKYYKVKTKER